MTGNTLERLPGEPAYVCLARVTKAEILSGALAQGSKLPSKRVLSDRLGVSVITVGNAYKLLEDEGYVYSRERSGYFVRGTGVVPPPRRSEKLSEQPPAAEVDFPFSTLAKLMRRVTLTYGKQLLLKPPNSGIYELRRAVSDYLARCRGMRALPENIVIGSGAEYLYGMVVQLLGRDKVYGVENPSYEKIKAVYEAFGARTELLSMESGGISSGALSDSRADVLHVTPFHSYPSGESATAAKRLEYLAWARRTGGTIVEDDYDSEFSIGPRAVETLFSMDGGGSVVYINTFTKSLAPSMRLGYMVLPDRLAEEYARKLGFYSCTVPSFDQYVLAEFIDGGYFERHLNRLRRKRSKSTGGA